MTTQPDGCPKCRGEMVQGFVVDGNAYATMVSTWSAGQLEKSFSLGTKGGEQIPIGSFPRSRRGYLESYAGRELRAR